jgi:aspartate racemase
MKTIGLIGGTGWLSTVDYYRFINEETNKILGGLNAGKILLYSFNYAEIDALNKKNDLDGVYSLVLNASKKLTGIGAEGIVICANTLHMFADKLANEITVPIVHIGDATAKEIKRGNLSKVGLLGTKYTMEMDFYTARLEKANIETIVPEKEDRDFIHSTIMNELLKEIFKKESKDRLLSIIEKLKSKGTQGIVLGCTEIPLIIKPGDLDIPLFNTTIIHSKAAVDFMLN